MADKMDDLKLPSRIKYARYGLFAWLGLICLFMVGIGLILAILNSYKAVSMSVAAASEGFVEPEITIFNIQARLGNRDVSIVDASTVSEYADYWLGTEIICENDTVFDRSTDTPDKEHKGKIWLTNRCDEEVTIEVCWYENPWLRFILTPFDC